MGFRYIDISGDAGLRAEGGTLREAFESAALGMYGLITDLEKISEKKELKVAIESHSVEGLLVSFLNELIFRFDTYGFIGRRADIPEITENRLVAAIKGEDFDPERHERGLLLKAATYHDLKVERKSGLWQFEVIFDI